MPAGLMVAVCLALAGSVCLINLIRGTENQQRVTIPVQERVALKLLLGFSNRHFPPAITRRLVKSVLNHLLHPVLVNVHLGDSFRVASTDRGIILFYFTVVK